VVAKRHALELNRKAAAEQIGISAHSLGRLEREAHLPRGEALIRVARWAGFDTEPAPTQIPHEVERDDSGDAMELHLRADKDLSDEDAALLVDLMRAASARLKE
jgi:DNA-binding XRE family transcriptional regulator